MNIPADTLDEQLSAFMDGELPEAEARFLQRRLEHDVELRAKWMRLQVAATCIKGQPWRPMLDSLSGQVQAELNQAPAVNPVSRRPLLRWAVAASIAALAIMLAPRLMPGNGSDAATVATSTATPDVERVAASPASADLVAERSIPVPAVAPTRVDSPAPTSAEDDIIAGATEATALASSMPLSSPADFPLVESGDRRTWPRSGLGSVAADPAIEAYLVRHNQMLANDGLGGFVPYVDVVARDQPATTPEADGAGQDGGAKDQ